MNPSGSVTLQTIADTLGMSRSTVSLALRDAPQVALSTRDRVQATAVDLGYVVNRNAVRLRTHSRNLVGLVVPDVTNPVVSEAALGLQRAVDRRGLTVTLSNTFDDVVVQTRVVQELVAEQVAGILLLPALGTSCQDLAQATLSAVPMVFFNRPVEGSDAVVIRTDDESVTEIALDHVMKAHAASSVGYFGGIGQAGPRVDRFHRFRSLCVDRGVRVSMDWSQASPSSSLAAANVARDLLRSGRRLPDAIVAHNDVVALGLLRAFHEHGVRPTDCPLVSIDNIDQAAVSVPSLTTVSIEPGALGELAGEHLLGLVNGHVVQRTPPTPHLVVRESCGCQPLM